MRRFVEITLRVSGIHNWPGAVSEVFYLAHPHRHTFTFRLRVSVNDGDREVEFIMLRNRLQQSLLENFPPPPSAGFNEPLFFGARSCEALAEWMWSWAESFGLTPIESSVSEDDEFTGGVSRG